MQSTLGPVKLIVHFVLSALRRPCFPSQLQSSCLECRSCEARPWPAMLKRTYSKTNYLHYLFNQIFRIHREFSVITISYQSVNCQKDARMHSYLVFFWLPKASENLFGLLVGVDVFIRMCSQIRGKNFAFNSFVLT